MSVSAAAFPLSSVPVVNVATVPQRSPLRYPGGKTWLIPHVRRWLAEIPSPACLLDPFAGGGIVSLTAVMENLVERSVMIDLDRDVAAFWRAALEHTSDLIARIDGFSLTRTSVRRLSSAPLSDVVSHGFRTLVLNRTRRGGVLAPGASFTKRGENGNGISSRWYASTLQKRLQEISTCADRIAFYEGDGIRAMEVLAQTPGIAMFVDPPYTAGGKRAGSRLYAHNDVDHERIFQVLAGSEAEFMMTYDDSPEVVALIHKHGFHAAHVAMKNGHHDILPELIITNRCLFT